jgi:predicted RNase H-like HicB family nuclease
MALEKANLRYNIINAILHSQLIHCMNIQRIKNTKKEGVIEFLVYKDKTGYTGVCLTFDIVEEGSNPTELMKSLKEAAELHLETVIKNNLSDELLNRYAPEEYWKKYFELLEGIKKPRSEKSKNSFVVSPYYSPLTRQVA